MNRVIIKKIDNIIKNLSETEQLDIIVYVSSRLKNKLKHHRPIDLAGFLLGKVDPNFNIDSALKEIRGDWLKKKNNKTNE